MAVSRTSLAVFLFFHALFFHSNTVVTAQETTDISRSSPVETATTTTQDEDQVELVNSLEDMTDSQLEAICANRGFELLTKDEATGEPLPWTHKDYMEAAQQCLDVEAEMEKLMKERPDIVQELEKERDEMQARKDNLEAELAAKLSQQQKLEKEEEGMAFVDDSTTATTDSDNEESSAKNSKNNSIKKDKIQPTPNGAAAKKAATNDRFKFASLMKEGFVEARDQIQRDWNMVSEIILPKSVRGPLNERVIRPLIRIAKNTGNTVLDLIKKYVHLIIESKLKKKKAAGVDT